MSWTHAHTQTYSTAGVQQKRLFKRIYEVSVRTLWMLKWYRHSARDDAAQARGKGRGGGLGRVTRFVLTCSPSVCLWVCPNIPVSVCQPVSHTSECYTAHTPHNNTHIQCFRAMLGTEAGRMSRFSELCRTTTLAVSSVLRCRFWQFRFFKWKAGAVKRGSRGVGSVTQNGGRLLIWIHRDLYRPLTFNPGEKI